MENELITITVRQDDIEKGRAKSNDSCPIALAFERIYPNARNIDVDGSQIGFHTYDKSCIILLPERAQDFIDKFDSYKLITPFQFEVEIIFREWLEDEYDRDE